MDVWKQKISLEKLTNTTIAPGLTIKEYFLRLEEKIDGLEIAKTNLVEYAKNFVTLLLYSRRSLENITMISSKSSKFR